MRFTAGRVQPAVLIAAIVTAAAWAQTAQAQSRSLPDLVGVSIQFQVTQHTTWGSGKPCQIYNVVPTIKNQGGQDAGRFKVQLQRKKNSGSLWEYVEACQTCTYDVPTGLPAGRSKTLDARSANNCSDNNWNWWRILVDSGGRVYEGMPGEANNATIEREYHALVMVPRTAIPIQRP
jgi:hypothetical protein